MINKICLLSLLGAFLWPAVLLADSPPDSSMDSPHRALKPPSLTSKSQALSPDLKKEVRWFLTKKGQPRPNIATTTGLALVAQKHYGGDIALAYDRGQAILKAYNHLPEKLFWFRVEMDSKTFFEKQSRLYHEDGTLKEKYRHAKGQALYAKDWHKGDVDSAYAEGLALLKIPKISLPPVGERSLADNMLFLVPGLTVKRLPVVHSFISIKHEQALFEHLGWVTFPIIHSAKKWATVRARLIDPNGQIKPEWQGVTGQIRYAKKYTREDSHTAFQVQQQLFGNRPALKWQASLGVNAGEAKEIINFLKGTTFENSRSNNIEDLKRNQAFISENKGMSGLLKLARLYYEGSLIRAYRNILSLFEGDHKALYRQTGYLPFYNHLKTFGVSNTIPFYEEDKKILLLEKGGLNPLNKGMEGYVRFANGYYAGNMGTAYTNAKAVTEGQFSELRWVFFPGTTTEFQEINRYISLYASQGKNFRTTRAWTKSFAKTNNFVPAVWEDIEPKIRAVLHIRRAQSCEKIPFSD